jgi:hypothetical protein
MRSQCLVQLRLITDSFYSTNDAEEDDEAAMGGHFWKIKIVAEGRGAGS